jgi:hypothetical protein
MQSLTLIIIAMTLFTEATNVDMPTIRNVYQQAANNEAKAMYLLKKTEKHSETSATLLGYNGAATMMLAKFQFNPITKLDFFNKGKIILEQAIAKDDDNIELIFIRFSVQSNAPIFLDYNKHLFRDKQFLLVNIRDVKDKDLKLRIVQFLQSSSYLTHGERNSLQ